MAVSLSSMPRLVSLAAILALAASSLRAQSAIYGAGLQAWTGCWSAEQRFTPAAVVRFVCITPTADVNVADLATIEGKLVTHETIDATGRPHALEASGCTGSSRAAWSRDSRRVFLRTRGVCQGVPLATSAMFSISTSGEWLEIEGSAAHGATSVRVARYRDAGVPRGLPLDVATSIQRDRLARESTRAAFGAPVHLDDVIEALSLADADVISAWIHERAQRFDFTRADLARFDLTGVPPRVADALAATADSNAIVARAAGDSSSYGEGAGVDQAATGSSAIGDDLPLYGGVGDSTPVPSQRTGGTRAAQGRRSEPPRGGGTVRLGKPRR